MCLSLAVAGCVLWTSWQDMEFGLMTGPTRDRKENEESQCFLLQKQVLSFLGKACLQPWGQAILLTTSCLA